MRYEKGDKVMVGRHYGELVEAEVLGVGPNTLRVRLGSQLREYPAGTEFRVTYDWTFPADKAPLHRRNLKQGEGEDEGTTAGTTEGTTEGTESKATAEPKAAKQGTKADAKAPKKKPERPAAQGSKRQRTAVAAA